jgi:predicted O-methyltransferase YrrM
MPEATPTQAQVLALIQSLGADPERLKANWCLSPQAGQLLSLLAKVLKPQRILEVGTSIGYSGLWLSLALLETGGILETIDASDSRQAIAKGHFIQAGIEDRVRLHHGQALETMEGMKVQGLCFDLIFLDARKSEYLSYFRLSEGLLKSGGLLVADNTQSHRTRMADFIEAVSHSPDWDTAEIEAWGGLLLARKRH